MKIKILRNSLVRVYITKISIILKTLEMNKYCRYSEFKQLNIKLKYLF
jgi:hypothetical protein